MTYYRLTTWLIAGLTVAAAPLSASAQQFTMKKYAEVAGWTISTVKSEGQFLRCSAAVPNSGGSVSFNKSSEGLTLNVPLTATGDTLKGAVAIDGKPAKVEYHHGSDEEYMVFLNDAQIKQLRTAKTLAASVGKEKVDVPLAGLDAALRKNNECFEKAGQ